MKKYRRAEGINGKREDGVKREKRVEKGSGGEVWGKHRECV